MSLAKITCIGFEEYLNAHGKSLFDDAVFPPDIERDSLIKRILLRAGEFECVYSNPDFMIGAVGTWATSFYHTFDKWIKALNTEYNPLENYNRTEIWDDKADSTTTASNSSGTSGTDTTKVSAYDAADFVNKDQLDSSSSTNSNAIDNASFYLDHYLGNTRISDNDITDITKEKLKEFEAVSDAKNYKKQKSFMDKLKDFFD